MSAIQSDPESMHGVPCFAGTRVPVDTLFNYLADGDDLAAFLADFPGVSRGQAAAVLEEARANLIGPHWLRDRRAAQDEVAPALQSVMPRAVVHVG